MTPPSKAQGARKEAASKGDQTQANAGQPVVDPASSPPPAPDEPQGAQTGNAPQGVGGVQPEGAQSAESQAHIDQGAEAGPLTAPGAPVAGAAAGVPQAAQGTESTLIGSNEVPGDYDMSAEQRLRAEDRARQDSGEVQYGVPGATGTVVGPDTDTGSLTVDVNSNLTLGGKFLAFGEKGVEVPNNSETQGALAAGHLSLSEERETADSTS